MYKVIYLREQYDNFKYKTYRKTVIELSRQCFLLGHIQYESVDDWRFK